MNLSRLLVISTVFITFISTAQVKIKETDEMVTLSNSQIAVTFIKNKAEIKGIKFNNHYNILGDDGSGYLMGPNFGMNPANFKIVRESPELIEISFDHRNVKNNLRYTLHYVLTNNASGIYCYLVVKHKASDPVGVYNQTRWGLRADNRYFDYHLVRDSIQGPMPTKAELKDADKVQDWTFKMPDGSIYTKYDYADYIENRHVHGMAGEKSGMGLFVIQASHEYLNGGPTKQYQNVHAGPFLINMFKCGHFLSDIREGDGQITEDWVKLHGPFLLYANKGKNMEEVWADAKKQSINEIKQWPYKWMSHPEYPLERGTVTGNIILKSGSPGMLKMVLAAPNSDWQEQSQDYIFSGRSDAEGNFELKNVRPGTYTLYVYGANVMEQFVKNEITVKAGAITALGKQLWEPASNGQTLWQIGTADRRTTGFNLSDHKREYGLFEVPPANLTFTIGKNKEAEDWYYAQTKYGSWNIEFDNQKQFSGNATLTLALAGAARWPVIEIWVNDKKVTLLENLGNDASVYRSAIAGGYYQKKQVIFASSLLKPGKNVIAFKMIRVHPKSGLMYDAIKLEAN